VVSVFGLVKRGRDSYDRDPKHDGCHRWRFGRRSGNELGDGNWPASRCSTQDAGRGRRGLAGSRPWNSAAHWPSCTRAMEQANHLAAAAAFGFGYAQLHKHIPAAPAVMLGAIYGASLYVTNIAGIAPLIRLTSGERNTSTPVRVERLGLHVLYGVVTAIVTDQLARGRERNTVLGSWSEV